MMELPVKLRRACYFDQPTGDACSGNALPQLALDDMLYIGKLDSEGNPFRQNISAVISAIDEHHLCTERGWTIGAYRLARIRRLHSRKRTQ